MAETLKAERPYVGWETVALVLGVGEYTATRIVRRYGFRLGKRWVLHRKTLQDMVEGRVLPILHDEEAPHA